MPQPDGPDERDELARPDLEVDVLQRGDAALRERLRDVPASDDGRVARSCEVLRRAAHDELLGQDDGEEEEDPEQRRDEVRRPEARAARAT